MRYKAGDRVIPVSKTTGVRWEDSNTVVEAQSQGYIYVWRYNKEEDNYRCGKNVSSGVNALFNEKDLNLYTEEKTERRILGNVLRTTTKKRPNEV